MSSSNNTKKRRVGAASSSRVGDDENNGSLAVCDELKTMSTHMSSMMELMMNMQGELKSMRGDMNKMKEEITGMRGDMKNMQGEIMQLTEKCDGMERTIQKTTKNTKRLLSSRFDDIDDHFDDMHDRINYHEVLLENQKWVYSAPRPSQEYWDSLDAESAIIWYNDASS